MIIRIRLLVVEMVNQKTKPEQEPENKGTLMLDATCAPSNIRYPQDFSLLNEAREKLETIIIRFCKSYGFSMTTYVSQASQKELTLHLRKQKNAALRKSEQPFVNS